MKSTLYIIKIGGNIIDDEAKLNSFLQDFASLDGDKLLVHGGGKLATRMAEQLKINQQIVDGRRITDAETLKVVTMVYAGYVNKNIVAKLQAGNCNAIGLTGADGDAILAHKRKHPVMDYGYVGDIDTINTRLLKMLLANNLTPVVAPITHDQQGQLLNTNADTIAQEISKSLSGDYDVVLIYSFEKEGVLRDAGSDDTVIPVLDKKSYHNLRMEGAIYAGMIPKLDNAFSAIENGVSKVIIGKAEKLRALMNGSAGTTLIND